MDTENILALQGICVVARQHVLIAKESENTVSSACLTGGSSTEEILLRSEPSPRADGH